MKKFLALGIIALALATACPGLAISAQSPKVESAAITTVDLNSATLKELQSLPGVGKVTAQKIDDYRKRHPFTSIEELMQVKGVGPKTFSKIKHRLAVE